MTMKTKTTYGMFGIVAVAAILSVALIASATTPAAQAVAANKFAFSEDATSLSATWGKGDATETASVTIGPVDIKSSDKNNWHVGFTGECKNFSEVQATGKKGKNSDTSAELSGAVSGATATLIVDKGTVNEDRLYSWKLCENDLQIEADLNALIEFNADLYCDSSDPLNVDVNCGGLDFVCEEFLDDGTTPNPEFTSVDCQQWVAVSSAVSGAYHTEWVVENVQAGDHTFTVLIEMTAGASGGETIIEDEPNGVESIVTIRQKILTADTVHIANPNS